MEKETGLDVVKPMDKDLLRSLENGAHFHFSLFAVTFASNFVPTYH